MLGQILRALVGEVVQGDDPVVVRASIEQHDLGQVGQLAALLDELLELTFVLGEDDLRVGVGQDVGGVLGVRAGVDGGRRRAFHAGNKVDPRIAQRLAHDLCGFIFFVSQLGNAMQPMPQADRLGKDRS